MRTAFEIKDDKEVRLWNKYMSNTYEPLNNPNNTVQDSGLYEGQVGFKYSANHLLSMWEKKSKFIICIIKFSFYFRNAIVVQSTPQITFILTLNIFNCIFECLCSRLPMRVSAIRSDAYTTFDFYVDHFALDHSHWRKKWRRHMAKANERVSHWSYVI